MSEPKWTPGPWSYFKDTCRVCDEEGTAEFVISGPPGGRHGQFSNEADARLIAAAPDLYDVLYAMMFAYADDEVWKQEAYAALAKAEGREP